MKKYLKPEFKAENFEITDIITASENVFDGLADLDKSAGTNWGEEILDPKDTF